MLREILSPHDQATDVPTQRAIIVVIAHDLVNHLQRAKRFEALLLSMRNVAQLTTCPVG